MLQKYSGFFRTALLMFFCIVCGSLTGIQAQEKLINGGFESGLNGWKGDGTISNDNPHSGMNCLNINDNSTTLTLSEEQFDRIPVSGDKWYEFKVWVRSNIQGQPLHIVIPQYKDSLPQLDGGGNDTSWIWGKNYLINLNADTQWTLFKLTFRNFDPQTKVITIQLRPTDYVTWPNDLQVGNAWFDDVSFTEIEPNQPGNGCWLAKKDHINIWQSPVEQKVLPNIEPPVDSTRTSVELFAAKGEYEAFQLVMKCSIPKTDSLIEISRPILRSNSNGFQIPDSSITIREVAYLQVSQPTDESSFKGWIPDPLPVVKFPLSLNYQTQNRNQQPIWVTVHVPQNAPGGIYQGKIGLRFQNAGVIEIPVSLQVWNFDLPRETTMRSSYGIDLNTIDNYHHLGNDPILRKQVFRKYLQDFKEHRICPTDPFGDDLITTDLIDSNGTKLVSWTGGEVGTDPDNPANHVMLIADNDTTASVSTLSSPFSFTRKGNYRFSWKVKTDGIHDYEVYISQFTSGGNFISGKNIGIHKTGSGAWELIDTTLPLSRFEPNTAFIELKLHACPYTDDGKLTGSTWFDDVNFGPAGSPDSSTKFDTFSPLDAHNINVVNHYDKFADAADYALNQLKFNSFRLQLPLFASGFQNKITYVNFAVQIWGTSGYENIFTKYFQTITNYLKINGWNEKAYTYWYDEATDSMYNTVIKGMRMLYNADSTIKRLMTVCNSRDTALNGSVDIWVPILNNYNKTWADQLHLGNDEMWWYVCCGPIAPYATDFIDHPGIEHRIRYWMAEKYNISGDLYWAVNYYRSGSLGVNNPWLNPLSMSDVNSSYGNGDGRLVYPPRDYQSTGTPIIEGPTPSLRWELIREGIEDYDYFSLLKRAADSVSIVIKTPEDSIFVARAQQLLSVPDSIISSLISYNEDSRLISAQRKDIGELLNKLYEKSHKINGLEVYARDEGIRENNSLKPRIYIKNNGTRTISNFKLCYYFNIENESTIPVVENWFAPSTNVSLRQLNDRNFCITYDFVGVTLRPGQVFPDLGGSIIGVHYSDWSNLNKSNDFSQCGGNMTINNTVALFDSLGNLIYGSIPTDTGVTEVSVEAYSKEDNLSAFNQSAPNIYLKNLKDALSDFKMIYYFTIENGKTPQLRDYYTPYCTAVLEWLSGNDYKITFDYRGYTLPAKTAEVGRSICQVGLNYSDWTAWNKNNDSSNNLSNTYLINSRIEVYDRNGNRIYGTR